MSVQDVFYLILTIGTLVLVVLISFLIIRLVRILDSLKKLVENVNDTAADMRMVKDQFKKGVFSALSLILGVFFGRRR